MDARTESEPARMKNLPTMERKSERELVVTRTVNGPQRLVFEACTNPELFLRWWVPRSAGISVLSHEMDIRTGGKYRLVFAHSPQPMEFFGKYIEVTPHSRIVWSNDEAHGGGAVTTMTLEDKGDQTLLVISDRYPTSARERARLRRLGCHARATRPAGRAARYHAPRRPTDIASAKPESRDRRRRVHAPPPGMDLGRRSGEYGGLADVCMS